MLSSTTLQVYNALIPVIRAEQERRAGKLDLLSYRNIIAFLKKMVANETLAEPWENQLHSVMATHTRLPQEEVQAAFLALIEFFRESAYAQASGSNNQRSPLDLAWVP